jgi:capsular polysaccharide transport system permease protein
MATLSEPRPPPGAARPRGQRLRVIAALVIREMGTRFGRSSGGYLWAIAEPLGGIVLLSVAFALALRSPPLGSSFMLFYATGIVPFTMFNSMARGVAQAVSSNRGLLNYPVVTLLDAVIAKVILNAVTLIVIAAVLFAGIILLDDLYVTLDLAAAALGLVLAAVFGIGVGMVNCVLFGFFPTWKNVWSVLTRPLFIVSGIFYIIEVAPPKLQDVLWFNPLVHAIAVMRTGFYATYDPQDISLAYVFGIALGLILVGGYLLRRHEVFLIEQ